MAIPVSPPSPLTTALMPTLNSATSLPLFNCLLIAEFTTPNVALDIFDGRSEKVKALIKRISQDWPLFPKSASAIKDDFNDTHEIALELLEEKQRFQRIPHLLKQLRDVQIVVAINSEGMQGLLIFERGRQVWTITLLISAPWNVVRTANSCEGVGTALLNLVTSEAAANSKTLELDPTDTVKVFYERAGFVKGPGPFMQKPPKPIGIN